MRNSTNVRTLLPVRSKVLTGFALALAGSLLPGALRGTRQYRPVRMGRLRVSATVCWRNPRSATTGERMRRRATSMGGSTATTCACTTRSCISARSRPQAAPTPAARSGPTPRNRASAGRNAEDLCHRGGRVPTRSSDACMPAREPLPQSSSHDRRVASGRTWKRAWLAAQPHRECMARMEEHGERPRVQSRRVERDRGGEESGEGTRTSRGSGDRSARGYQRGHPDKHFLLRLVVAERLAGMKGAWQEPRAPRAQGGAWPAKTHTRSPWSQVLRSRFSPRSCDLSARTGGAPVLRASARVAFWGVLALRLIALVGRVFGTVV